jgi:hypothetical protein
MLLLVQHFIRMTVGQVGVTMSTHAEMESTIFASNVVLVKLDKIISRYWQDFFHNQGTIFGVHNAYAI